MERDSEELRRLLGLLDRTPNNTIATEMLLAHCLDPFNHYITGNNHHAEHTVRVHPTNPRTHL